MIVLGIIMCLLTFYLAVNEIIRLNKTNGGERFIFYPLFLLIIAIFIFISTIIYLMK